MTLRQPIVAATIVALVLTATPQHRLVAQAGLPAGDSTAIMEAALSEAQTHLSAKRRFIDPANDDHALPAARAARFGAKVKAAVAHRDVYTTCDANHRCRIAADAEVVSIEPPVLDGNDKARARVIARQGTNIQRMPVATSTLSYTLERRGGVWTVTGVRVTRQ